MFKNGGDVDSDSRRVVSVADVAALVDRWFTDNFHNTVVSQDVQVHNALYAAKEDLKQQISNL